MACNCSNERIIPGVNTPKGSKHLSTCPSLESFLFYWEEAVDAWVPCPNETFSIIDTDNIDEGEEREIRFKHFRMTKAEYDSLPVS